MSNTEDIDQWPTFSRSFFGGYSIVEVNRFIGGLFERLKQQTEEISSLQEKNQSLKSELALRTEGSFGFIHNKIEETQRLLASLRQLAAQDVAQFIANEESKDTVALLQTLSTDQQLIALHLMGEAAEEIFSLLPRATQKDLLLLLSETKQISTEEVKQVLTLLHSSFDFTEESRSLSIEGEDFRLSLLHSLLDPLPLIDEVAKSRPELGKTLRAETIVFSDIIFLDRNHFLTLRRLTNEDDWIAVFPICSEELKELFFSSMSKRMYEEFQEYLAYAHTQPLKEIEQSQFRILQSLRDGVRDEVIVLLRPE